MDASGLKGPAFPGDFSDDVPEYTDEELDSEMEKAERELLGVAEDEEE
jgi:hypothetical protein